MISASLTAVGQDKKSYDIDFTNPESVVNAILYAAQTENFGILQCLCDPYGQGDGDTKRLCDYSYSEETKNPLDKFFEMIEQGANEAAIDSLLNGQVTYEKHKESEYANVPLFDVQLVKRHGNRYLFQF